MSIDRTLTALPSANDLFNSAAAVSRAEKHIRDSYPVSSSRRRRMLAIQSADRPAPASPADDGSRTPETSDAAAFVPDADFDFHDADEALAGVIASPEPVTWLLAGERFTSGPVAGRPSFVEHFASGLRSRIRSASDPVVDACVPGFRLADDVGSRVLRLHPHVVFLLCGSADHRAGLDVLGPFEDALHRTASRLQKAGVLLVLNTPPAQQMPDDAAAAARLIYTEAVRAFSAEWELPLVDHARRWEQSAVPAGLNGSWFDESGSVPSAIGHQQIAAAMLQMLTAVPPAPPAGVTGLAATSA